MKHEYTSKWQLEVKRCWDCGNWYGVEDERCLSGCPFCQRSAIGKLEEKLRRVRAAHRASLKRGKK